MAILLQLLAAHNLYMVGPIVVQVVAYLVPVA